MHDLPPPDLIPPGGLKEVLRGWSGKGLLNTIANLPGPELSDLRWRPSDVLSRADRVLLSALCEGPDGEGGPILRLPRWTGRWIDALPATALSHRKIDSAPFRGVNWVATLRVHGWPPRAFSGRVRHRASDDVILTPAAWVLGRLTQIGKSVAQLPDALRTEAAPRLTAVAELLQHESFEGLLDGDRPASADLDLLSSEGTPWSTVATIGKEIARIEDDPYEMATRIIFPDESIAWRLFHLGCLGEILLALKGDGFNVAFERPLGGESRGPVYLAERGAEKLHIWFEAAGAWNYYGTSSPYCAATPSDGRALGADVMIRDEGGTRALFVECKYYPSNPAQIPRDGYLQALAYAAEARGILADHVAAVAVGPDRLVPTSGRADTSAGPIFVVPHHQLRGLTTTFAGGDDLTQWQPPVLATTASTL